MDTGFHTELVHNPPVRTSQQKTCKYLFHQRHNHWQSTFPNTFLHQISFPMPTRSIMIPPFPGKFTPLRILTAICPSSTLFILTHTCPQGYVHSGWCREPERFCKFDKVELLNVENATEGMGAVSV